MPGNGSTQSLFQDPVQAGNIGPVRSRSFSRALLSWHCILRHRT